MMQVEVKFLPGDVVRHVRRGWVAPIVRVTINNRGQAEYAVRYKEAMGGEFLAHAEDIESVDGRPLR